MSGTMSSRRSRAQNGFFGGCDCRLCKDGGSMDTPPSYGRIRAGEKRQWKRDAEQF